MWWIYIYFHQICILHPKWLSIDITVFYKLLIILR
jgi:hypothetical protein